MKDINKIWKFLQQQLSSEEQRSLEDWKTISNENNDLYSDIKEIWAESEHVEEIQVFEAENAWAEIDDLLEEKRKPVIRPLGWISIAASFVLLAAALFWFYRPEEIIIVEEPIYRTIQAIDQNEELNLPDSSVVSLFEGSSLRYFTRIDDSFKDRRIFLSGKATFDVASNDSLPFVVEAAGTGVKVLGTIFNVDLKDSSDISVENIEGLIKFYELQNEANAVTLNQGETFTYDGEAFVDKTPRVEKKVVKKIVIKDYTIQELWYELINKFDSKLRIESYGSNDPNATIRLNLDQSLPKIIETLESNSKVNIKYSQSCPDCFEIETLTIMN